MRAIRTWNRPPRRAPTLRIGIGIGIDFPPGAPRAGGRRSEARYRWRSRSRRRIQIGMAPGTRRSPGWATKRARPAVCSAGRAGVPATTYFRAAYSRTIIGEAAFHFRVRHGTGWGRRSMVTRPGGPLSRGPPGLAATNLAHGARWEGGLGGRRGPRWGRADGPISTGWLSASRRLHPRPIDGVVCPGPRWEISSRGGLGA